MGTEFNNAGMGFTNDGGIYKTMINKTGAPTVLGSVIQPYKGATVIVNAFQLCAAPYYDPIGIVVEAGIADGSSCKVVFAGSAYVRLKENSGATKGNWVGPSTVAGDADATVADPPGGGVTELQEHFKEIGHAHETVAAGGAGVWKLCLCEIHFC